MLAPFGVRSANLREVGLGIQDDEERRQRGMQWWRGALICPDEPKLTYGFNLVQIGMRAYNEYYHNCSAYLFLMKVPLPFLQIRNGLDRGICCDGSLNTGRDVQEGGHGYEWEGKKR